MNCPKCQTQNPEKFNFCAHCGILLVRNCPRCDFENSEESNYCGNCGLGLSPSANFVWNDNWELTGGPLPAQSIISPANTGDIAQPSKAKPKGSLPVASSSQPHLDQYIPKELLSKLETAHAGGGMQGERRIVTMLFCDVKGSTAAAELLDPEEWTEIINGAFEYMIKPVYKYEGTVARLMGDGILAFFGAPIAHEDDPNRAVLTGLEIVTGLSPYRKKILEKWDVDLNVRVGINTGLVVVGAVGSDLRMEYTAMGNAINLAARMEQTAAPGTVQITHDTYKLVAPSFEFKKLESVTIKGKEEPVPAYQVLGRNTSPSRLRGIEGLEADLVGRSQEMTRLQSIISDLERGIGGVLCLLGGAGLGKTRLIQELKGGIATESIIEWYDIASLSYETTLPYALFQRLIRRILGIKIGDDTNQFWEKIQTLTNTFSAKAVTRHTRVFASLFGMVDPSGQTLLEGEHFKRELYAAMREILPVQFSSQASVLVLDDLHWADPASIDLLLHLLPMIDNNPLVFICAFRPDREAPSYQIKQIADTDFHHRYTEINLRPLSSDQSDELVNRLLAVSELPDSLRQRIQERAAGNPFFVEEVVRTLIDKGAVVAEDRSENGSIRRYWRPTSASEDIDIPDNLQGLLISRIDRLEEGTRQVMQLASVIGRSFYHRVLTEIGQSDELNVETVDEQISQLVRLEMIQEATRVPDIEYKFRNPLTQEVAYQSILLKKRQEFHRRVGEALEMLFPDQLVELAPRLAFHYAEGKQADKAFENFLLAGDNAFRLFALDEALINFDLAMQWSKKSETPSEQLIHLYRRRGRTLELLLRINEALETYQSLERLGEARDNDSLRLAGITEQAILYSVSRTDPEASKLHSEAALGLARQLGDRSTEARSLWSLLLANAWSAKEEALAYGEEGLLIARELVEDADVTNEELEILALLLLDLSVPLVGLGQVEESIRKTLEAKELFEQIGNLPMVTTAAQRLGMAYKAVGRFQESEKVYQQATEIDISIGNSGGLIGSSLGLMDIYPQTGNIQRFLVILEQLKPILGAGRQVPEEVAKFFPLVIYFYMGAYDRVLELADDVIEFNRTRTMIWADSFLVVLIRTYVGMNDYELGKKLLARIGADIDGENYLSPMAAHLPQVKAELALSDGDWQGALDMVENYIGKAREKGMLSFLTEKLMLKSEILIAAGEKDSGYDVLREAYALSHDQNTRMFLWELCAQLAAREIDVGNHTEAENFYKQARSAVDFIVDHAGQDDLRDAFLTKPLVQTVISKTNEFE